MLGTSPQFYSTLLMILSTSPFADCAKDPAYFDSPDYPSEKNAK